MSNRAKEIEEFRKLDRRFDSLLRGLHKFAREAENPKLQAELYDYISDVSGTYATFKETALAYSRHVIIKRTKTRRDEDDVADGGQGE